MKVTVNTDSSILAGNTYEFKKNLTILVGGNGSGKSSLLKAISLNINPDLGLIPSALESTDISITDAPPVQDLSTFISEMNLRTDSYHGTNKLDKRLAMRISSGESTMIQSVNAIHSPFSILDEPDQSLDLYNKYSLLMIINKLKKNGSGKIILTIKCHQLLLALSENDDNLFDVIDVLTGKKTTVKDYIEEQLKCIKEKEGDISIDLFKSF